MSSPDSVHAAARGGNVEALRVLLAASADVHAKDDNGFTPLHWAARNGHAEVVRILLDADADAKAAAKDG